MGNKSNIKRQLKIDWKNVDWKNVGLFIWQLLGLGIGLTLFVPTYPNGETILNIRGQSLATLWGSIQIPFSPLVFVLSVLGVVVGVNVVFFILHKIKIL